MSASEEKIKPKSDSAQTSAGHGDGKQTHPICQFAPDKEKCEAFVERLSQAASNIERRRST